METTNKTSANNELVALIIAVATAAILFVVDLASPLGVAIGVGYCLVVLIIAWRGCSKHILLSAAVTSLLVALALLNKSLSTTPLSVVVANRAISIATIWIVAVLAHRLRNRETVALDDVEYERQILAVRGSFDGLWDWRPTSGELHGSPRFMELLGYQGSSFSNCAISWKSILHPEDFEPMMQALKEHLEHHTPYDVEHRCRQQSGEYRWFRSRAQAIWDSSEKSERVAGSITDITLQKSAQLRLEFALAAANEGIWDWDLRDNSTFFNETWFTMLGYLPNEFPMNLENWKELFHPEDLPRTLEQVERHLRGEISLYKCEHRLRRKDGAWHWVLGVGEVIERDENHQPKRLVGVHIDIDELKQNEAALTEAREVALEASRGKSQFLANMSHEIRTPMNGVLGMIQLALDTDLSSEQRDLLTTADSSAHTLLNLINDILDFSKIEAGKLDIIHEDFNLQTELGTLEKILSFSTSQKQINLTVSVDKEVPIDIRGDANRLMQVLINLLSNSIKFTSPGGGISLHISVEARQEHGLLLRFTTIDSGIGIPKHAQERIFEAFTQADSTTTRNFGGTGLGLTISAKLVKLMGGELEVRSIEGVGTTFSFTVAIVPTPRDSSPPSEKDCQKVKLSAVRRALSVLLVEDNPVNQKVARRILEKEGHRVTIAENGVHAVESFTRERYDIILMDIEMPVMDGIRATELIRKQENGSHTPIVALTANAMTGDREKYLGCGMNGYVTKPIDRKQLLTTISGLVFDDDTHNGRDNER